MIHEARKGAPGRRRRVALADGMERGMGVAAITAPAVRAQVTAAPELGSQQLLQLPQEIVASLCFNQSAREVGGDAAAARFATNSTSHYSDAITRYVRRH